MNRKQRNKATLLKKHFRERERSLQKALQKARGTEGRAQYGAQLLEISFQQIMVRLALKYAEVTSSNAKGEPNGFCLTLPPMEYKEAQRWKVYGENDADGTTRIGVALRDEPEDGMSEAEIEAKKEEGR